MKYLLFISLMAFSLTAVAQQQLTHTGTITKVTPHYEVLSKTSKIYSCQGRPVGCKEWADRVTKYRDGYTIEYIILGELLTMQTTRSYQIGDDVEVLLVVLPY